jgi:hypothetical protein
MRCDLKRLFIHIQYLVLSAGTFILIGACTAVPDQKDWITIGHTTREEVVARYGQPDVVIATSGGETVVYRPRDSGVSPPPVQIPTIQAGPLGTVTTKTEPMNSGINTRSTNGKLQNRPAQELRIQYDAQGIVQELSR